MFLNVAKKVFFCDASHIYEENIFMFNLRLVVVRYAPRNEKPVPETVSWEAVYWKRMGLQQKWY